MGRERATRGGGRLTNGVRAQEAALEEIIGWRDMYRAAMNCQIIHESLHARAGWTQEYLLRIGDTAIGYGSVAVAGPWSGRRVVYEFYVAPPYREHLFDAFQALLAGSVADGIEVQSNDELSTIMLHAFARDVESESVLFRDDRRTWHAPDGAIFRMPAPFEVPDITTEQLPWHGVVECEGRIAATGGVLFHYNRPYGDLYMEVGEPFRKRGLGTFLVQELKRVCYEGGHVPAARCNPANVASRRTLQRAGFVPCGHILKGDLRETDARSSPGSPE